MVDSVAASAIKSFFQPQTTPAASTGVSGLPALKTNKKTAQTIIDQTQQNTNQSALLTSKRQTAALPSAASISAASGTNLPRGSLVDILA